MIMNRKPEFYWTNRDIMKMKRNLKLRGFTTQEKQAMRRIIKAHAMRKKMKCVI
jgi:hypothetical protein